MKKILTLLVFSFSLLICTAQTDTAYIHTYGGIQNDVCNQIKPTWDGGYITIGTTNSFGCGNTDFYVIKTDSLLNRQWSKALGGPLNDEGFSVAPTSDKGYAFVGFTDSYGHGGYDVLLVKTDSLGNVKWQKTYGGTDWDFGYSVSQLSDKGFIICGQTYSYGAGNGDVYVIRTDSVGDTLWTRAIGGTGYDIGNMVAVGKDSTFAIIGATTSFGKGDTSIYFLLLDHKGNIKRDTTYGCTHSSSGNSIRETMDSGFIIFGSTDSIQHGKPDEYLIKTDSLGKVQWSQIYHSSGISKGNDAIQLKDGYYFAVSTSNAYGAGGYAMRTWQITSGGWPTCAPSMGGTADEEGASIALGKNGGAVFAGTTDSPGYTEGLDDVYAVLYTKDTILNIYSTITTIHYFKDTCVCTLTSIGSVHSTQIGAKLFPNPVVSSSTLLIQGMEGHHYLYNIYNDMGQKLITNRAFQSLTHGQYISYLDKSNFTPGIYMCEILDSTDTIITLIKFIVE